jgi:ribonuclease HII
MDVKNFIQSLSGKVVIGIDEVGRGCWAGPLVVGAVILSKKIPGVSDSKILQKNIRSDIATQIRELADACSTGWVSASEVDELGLTAATTLAIERAIESILTYDYVVIDGSVNFLKENPKALTLVKADSLVPAVSSASIIAKVARDDYMEEQSLIYPEYGFERHVTVASAQLQANSITSRDIISVNTLPDETTVGMGNRAEGAVADFLINLGFQILDRNWKTRTCEIDIIAHKAATVYFVEVKYRSSLRQGDGMAYITSVKLHRMKYAANLWVAKNNWRGEYTLSAASVTGSKLAVEFMEQI